MYYNGKIKGGYEKIGISVSDETLFTGSVTARSRSWPMAEDKQNGISGDPQIVRMGDLWVMFYFGAFWKPKAFDTFACSYDLAPPTKWDGPAPGPSPLNRGTTQYAPTSPGSSSMTARSIISTSAVGNQGRVIALATSRKLARQTSPGVAAWSTER